MTDQLGKHSAGTANTRYAGLRAFFNFAVNEEIIEKTPIRGLVGYRGMRWITVGPADQPGTSTSGLPVRL